MQVASSSASEQAAQAKERLLEKFAHQLAENHTIANSPETEAMLLAYLPGWKKTLHEAHQSFGTAPSKGLVYSRAGEWMLDNFYVVEQTVRQIEEDMPPSYYRQLP